MSHAQYEAFCAKRSEKRAAERAKNRRAAEKIDRDYAAQKKISDTNQKRGCEHALKLRPGSVTHFDATVDGGGHFTGVTVYYTGGSQWIWTGRNVRGKHEYWERLGESLASRKRKSKKRSTK